MAGCLVQVRNTIQSGEVGKSAIEQLSSVQPPQVLGRKQLELDRRLRIFVVHALPGGRDHPWGGIAGNHGNVMLGEKEASSPVPQLSSRI